MRHRKVPCLVLLLLFISSGLFAQIQLKLTLSGVPSSVRIEKKNLKYGKFGAFCFIWDDRGPSAFDALSIMPYFTDGAGNPVQYTATIASDGVNRYEVDAGDLGALSFGQLKTLVLNNWGLSCHGYIHDVALWKDQGFTVYDNVVKNREYQYTKLKELGVEYVMRTGVVPNADPGYQLAWKSIGYLCGTTQNKEAFDGMTANPSESWVNGGVGDITNFTGRYQVFTRAFSNVDNQAGLDQMISNLNVLLAQSTDSTGRLLVFGNHGTTNSFLAPGLNYIQANGNDNIWVTSLHELMEYGETKDKTNISSTLSGNVLTINLTQNLPDANRWRDISLGLVSDKSIVRIEQTGADTISFNPATGLINVFKKKSSGFQDPDVAGTILALRFISFSSENGELRWSLVENENLSHYEVERSTDGIHFEVIGRTNEERYTDSSTGGHSFYRIKAINKNGSYAYSNTIRSNNSGRKSATIQNQGSGIRVYYYSEKDQDACLEIFNTGGQLLYRCSKKAMNGWNSVKVANLGGSGIYILKILNETIRFIHPG